MKFKGSIIITDPCYIMKSDDWDKYSDNICDNGNLSCIGFENSLCHDTLYGDWSCTTYKCRFEHLDILTETEDCRPFAYGEFCADAGMVCVCLVEDVLKYNSNFFKKYGTWCYTIVPNFDGDIRFEVVNDNLHVVGEGNKSFVTIQTGA